MPLKSRLLDFVNGIPRALDLGLEETAGDVLEERDNRVPVDEGDLLASGRVVQVSSGHWQVREGDGLPDARAIYTEYGTDKAAAQPHMTPAAEQHRGSLGKNVAKHLKALERKCRV